MFSYVLSIMSSMKLKRKLPRNGDSFLFIYFMILTIKLMDA